MLHGPSLSATFSLKRIVTLQLYIQPFNHCLLFVQHGSPSGRMQDSHVSSCVRSEYSIMMILGFPTTSPWGKFSSSPKPSYKIVLVGIVPQPNLVGSPIPIMIPTSFKNPSPAKTNTTIEDPKTQKSTTHHSVWPSKSHPPHSLPEG